MLFLFSITISLNLTQHQWEEIKRKEDSPPALIFAWAPWCPHCRAVFEAWARLSAKYQNDQNVQVLSVNCTDQGALCGSLGLRGYPSFFTFMNGVVSPTNVERNLNGFSKVVDSLKSKYQHVLDFAKKIKNAQYPAFVFKLRENDDAAYDIAIRASEELGLVQNTNFFLNYDNDLQGNCQLRAYSSPDYYKSFKDRFLFKNVLNFINNYRIPLFGSWSFESVSKTSRLFTLVFEDDKNTVINQYKDIAVKYDDLVSFGDVTHGTYLSSENTFIPTNELRSLFKINADSQKTIVLLNMKQNSDGSFSFYTIENGDKNKLEDFMKRYMERAPIEWKPLFIPKLTNDQKNEKRKEQKIINNNNNNNNRNVDNQNNVQANKDDYADNEDDSTSPNSDSKFIILFVGIGILICGVSVFAYRYFSKPQRKEE